MLRVKQHTKSGFSLVELSITIVIIALFLAAIASGSVAIAKSRLYSARSLTSSSPVVYMQSLVAWYETTSQNSFDRVSMNNDESIENWHNISPSADPEYPNDANQGAEINQPKYSKDQINGLPAISFDGSNNYFKFDGTDLVLNDYTIFIIEQRSGPEDNNYFIGSGDIALLDNKTLALGYESNEVILFGQHNNNYQFPTDVFVQYHVKVHAFRFSSSVGKNYYRNGLKIDSSGSSGGSLDSTAGLLSYDNARIGSYSYYNYHYKGDIGEIIIFNKALNNDEIKDIEKYLGRKWRIDLES
jgi:prepilin-type N-terminal cleavage/methylation domain-containing protein